MKKFMSLLAIIFFTHIVNAQLVINEVCLDNDTIKLDGETPDWVELYNTSDETINLNGWYISDKTKKPTKFCISGDYFIEPQKTFLIYCNDKDNGINTNFKLSSDGETIVLSNPDGELVDKVEVPALYADRSYGRVTNGNEKWAQFEVATPGKDNTNPKTATPVFSIPAGFYTTTQNIEISCEDNDAKIYYTLDGSEPTTSSFLYNNKEIEIKKTTSIRAIAVKSGYMNSSIATSSFFINSRKINIPVVCLTTNKKNFYDDQIGIYVAGKNGIPGKCNETPHNWNQDWERPIHFEYFDENKELILSVDAGIKITGTCSRDNEQKSLRIVARKEYGPDRLCYNFFPQKDIDEFKSIVLRSGSNDWCYTKLRDGISTIVASKNMDIDYQGFKPAAVFLNGEYFGLFNIREKISTHFVEENYGINHDNVNLLEDNWKVIDGTNEGFQKDVIDFVTNNNMADSENYKKICEHIDIDNFIDYWIIQLYIDNYDWPGNNVKYWNSDKKHPQWRWILFGHEYSTNLYGQDYYGEANSIYRSLKTKDTYFGNASWGCFLMNKLLENEEFKNNFIQRSAYHINTTLSAENFCFVADSLKNVIYDEWASQAQRWHAWHNTSSWESQVNQLKTWYTNRPKNARKHIKEFFNIDNMYSINVSSDCDNTIFYLYDYKVGNELSGSFFGKTPLKIKPDLPTNREFQYWEIKINDATQKIYTKELEYIPNSEASIKLISKNSYTALSNIKDDDEVIIYPNPTSDIAYINCSDDNISYMVISTNGELLFSGKGREISLRHLPSGQYLVKINDKLLKIMKK